MTPLTPFRLSKTRPLRAFSTFSGIGGFELGFRQACVPVSWVGHSEMDKFTLRIYRSHFTHSNYGDITHIDPSKTPEIDLITGGFPCQSFSYMGRRKGLEDPRGKLFFALAELINAKRPRFLLLENVKGLLGNNRGRSFRAILQTLSQLGYGVEWSVCNSAFFSVPQSRERVFLVGYLGGIPAKPIFPLSPKKSRASAKKRSAIAVRSVRQRQIRLHNLRFRPPGAPVPTLLRSERHGVRAGNRIRQLTPLEWERLQGFPDEWTRFGQKRDGTRVAMSDTLRYYSLGNAVTVNVVAAIAKRIFMR